MLRTIRIRHVEAVWLLEPTRPQATYGFHRYSVSVAVHLDFS